MQDVSSKLKQYLREERMSQAALARAANVSQSTVSRALRRQPSKHSDAFVTLCRYAVINVEETGDSTANRINVVNAAFMKIWDGTDRQALAIAKIVEALGGLSSLGKLQNEQNE